MKSVALMVYETNPSRDALTEENYKGLVDTLIELGFNVKSVLYHDTKAERLLLELEQFAAVLVWVNPIMEHGKNRGILDVLLRKVSDKGIFVSTHPDIILKIGTKKVLYTTRDMDWGGDIEMYTDYDDFVNSFHKTLIDSDIRILKQYRGDGGKGVYKVRLNDEKTVKVTHAVSGNEETVLSLDDFYTDFMRYFDNGGALINQRWNDGIINGMVRCYITGTKVSGFGYQEAVALCPDRPVSRRFYFTEDCGLFQDLRTVMDTKWIPQLQEIHSLTDNEMPLLWDIDLFINDVNANRTEQKYTICEINVSCVSPFPPSSINHVVAELKKRCV